MAPHDKDLKEYNAAQDRSEKKCAEEKQRHEDDRQDARQDARQEMRAEVRREERDAARKARDEADTGEFTPVTGYDVPHEARPMVSRVPQKADVPPVSTAEVMVKRIGWLKFTVVTGVALVAFGASAALYASRFSTAAEVEGRFAEHIAGPGHPVTQKTLQDINDRLIRVETIQQNELVVLQRIEAKLDEAIRSMIRGPAGPVGPVGATGAAGPSSPAQP